MRAKADVQQAQAQLNRAQDYVRRCAPLANIEAIPHQEYTDALAEEQVRAGELQQMEANRKIALASLAARLQVERVLRACEEYFCRK